jgi:ubiquinone/menaquinone biosynthesis C-methylase UbiE
MTSPRTSRSVLPDHREEEDVVNTSATAVSFKQYGGDAAENYQRYFVPTIGTATATALLDAVELRPGDRVLDVACGTGVVTRLAADRVGPDGVVAGLDINPAMLAVARSDPRSAGIEWHEGDAESLPLADGSFDVAVSSLGLQFVPDRASALHEMQRVLAPGGRLAIATAGPTPPLFAVLEHALAQHVTPKAAGFMGAVFSLHDPDELEKLASSAGFRGVEVRSQLLSITLPGPRDFLWQYVHSTPLRAAAVEIDDVGRAALERDVVAAWQSFVEDGAMIFDGNVVLTTARK